MKEPYGLVLQSLGKPSSNVPFMMPEEDVAETDPMHADQGRGRDRLGPVHLQAPTNGSRARRSSTSRTRSTSRAAEPASGLAGGKVVKLDRVEWIAMPDVQTQVGALQNGEIDMIESPRPRPAAAAGQGQEHQAGQLQPARQPVHLPLQQRCTSRSTTPRSVTPCSSPSTRRTSSRPRSAIRKWYKVCKAMFVCGTPLGDRSRHGRRAERQLRQGQGSC